MEGRGGDAADLQAAVVRVPKGWQARGVARLCLPLACLLLIGASQPCACGSFCRARQLSVHPAAPLRRPRSVRYWLAYMRRMSWCGGGMGAATPVNGHRACRSRARLNAAPCGGCRWRGVPPQPPVLRLHGPPPLLSLPLPCLPQAWRSLDLLRLKSGLDAGLSTASIELRFPLRVRPRASAAMPLAAAARAAPGSPCLLCAAAAAAVWPGSSTHPARCVPRPCYQVGPSIPCPSCRYLFAGVHG